MKFLQGNSMSRHENYEILNLIGYGLAKFDGQFEKLFGFQSKESFYQYMVACGVVETGSTVKNRQDLFDPFFPNPRRGWWQKGNAYIHRKHVIDALYGELSADDYAGVVRQYLAGKFGASFSSAAPAQPIQKSRFKQLQETGLEAELYFQHNYEQIKAFSGGLLEDARLLGDGYDFQVTLSSKFLLAEIKGVRAQAGAIRMTEREYTSAQEYEDLYSLVIISGLNDVPKMIAIPNPVKELRFDVQHLNSTQTVYCASNW